MRKRIWIATTGMLLLVAGMAWAQKSTVSPHQPSPMLQAASESEFDGGFCRITQMRATPNTIPFQATSRRRRCGRFGCHGELEYRPGKERSEMDIEGWHSFVEFQWMPQRAGIRR